MLIAKVLFSLYKDKKKQVRQNVCIHAENPFRTYIESRPCIMALARLTYCVCVHDVPVFSLNILMGIHVPF